MDFGFLLRDYSKRNGGKPVGIAPETVVAAANQIDSMRSALEAIRDGAQSKG